MGLFRVRVENRFNDLNFVSLLSRKMGSMGLSARQVSLTAGLSASYVSKVLGGMMPSLVAFSKIVNVLECSDKEIVFMLRMIDANIDAN